MAGLKNGFKLQRNALNVLEPPGGGGGVGGWAEGDDYDFGDSSSG